MVCLGNICRSPLAEGIMKTKVPQDFFVDSAGTIALHKGEHPDERSIEVAKQHHVDISKQKSRLVTTADLDQFNFIFCMDKSNLNDVLSLAKTQKQKNKISLIMPDGSNVPDPYYGGIQGFENVFRMLDEACTQRAEEILSF